MAKDTFQIGNTEEALVSKGMGTIETIGGTASQTYTAGSYFVGNDGFMYQADTDLTTADTLVSSGTGKNCTKTDIATELEEVNSEYGTLSNLRAELGAHNLLELNFAQIIKNNTGGTWSGNTYTIQGVTYTFTLDGNGGVKKITANTASQATGYAFLFIENYNLPSGNYIFNGGLDGYTNQLYYKANGSNQYIMSRDAITDFAFTWDASLADNHLLSCRFYLQSGQTVNNKDITPMIRKANDTVTAYQPYAKTNVELTKEIDGEVVTRATLGAHNLCPNEIEAATYQSVVVTNNDDGTSSITGSIATTDSNVGFVVAKDILLKAGKYVLSGIPDDIQAGFGYVQAYVTTTAGTDLSWADRGSDKSLAVKTLANDTHVKVNLVMYHTNAQTFNFTYKPMIALASDPSKEFTPYAMTNKELTENKAEKKDLTSVSVTGTTNTSGSTIAKGKYFYLNSTLCRALSDIASNATFTKNTNYEEVTAGALNALAIISSTYQNVRLMHNIPRLVPKDITSYVSDGSIWKRLNGTDGYELFEDIYVGDYWQMTEAISAYEQTQSYQTTGSKYVTIAGIDMHYGDGDGGGSVGTITYHHLDMVAGQGFDGTQHFGRSRMNSSNTTAGGYVGSEMFTTVIGDVTSTGKRASADATATINQQLYAEFGSHLKTQRCLLSNAIDSARYNRFGQAGGASSGWAWTSVQAVLMTEIECYGSIVWSSSGYDTGNGNKQLPLFAHSKQAMNNRSAYYWLRDVASSANFCYCSGDGYAYYNSASVANSCVRPRFILA